MITETRLIHCNLRALLALSMLFGGAALSQVEPGHSASAVTKAEPTVRLQLRHGSSAEVPTPAEILVIRQWSAGVMQDAADAKLRALSLEDC